MSTTRTSPPPPRRRRGLLDPDDLRGSHVRSQGDAQSLDHVRRWVMSILVVTTILHLAAGTALIPVVRDDISAVGQVVLLFLAACVGVVAVAAGRLIHQRTPWSLWLLLGLLPAAAGAWFTLS